MFDTRWARMHVRSGPQLRLYAPYPEADKYVVDPTHTTVTFVGKHLMIYNVRGKFHEFSGCHYV